MEWLQPLSLNSQKLSKAWARVPPREHKESRGAAAFLAVGLYGEVLPKQNGAPIRLVVPWKYGYKSIKSISRIRFTSEEPATSWNQSAPNEYGFYSNVNPNRAHPRWSQSSERIIGGGLLARRFARNPPFMRRTLSYRTAMRRAKARELARSMTAASGVCAAGGASRSNQAVAAAASTGAPIRFINSAVVLAASLSAR